MKAADFPEIARLWDYKKNTDEGISFEETTSGSGKKVWWKCDKGHEWQAIVCNVIGKGSSCPYCSGRKALPGVSDLSTLNSALAKEWNYEKNHNLVPSEVTPGSGKRVWWKCDKGHEWEAVISSRNTGVGCPYCAGRKVLSGFNDLATTHPSLAAEWNYEKNKNLTPQDVSFGSEKNVWWQCSNGHEWQAMVGDRVRGRGCPYCSRRRVLEGGNTLDVTNPEIVKMWNTEKNGNLLPSQVTAGSGRAVWWRCDKGHEWQTAPYNMTKEHGTGCPYCSNRVVLKGFNDLETLNPKIAKEWNYEKNGSLKPSEIIAGSTKNVWWRCNKGHEWQARVYSRNQNHSCPICNMYKVTSIPEKSIVYYLREAGLEVEENKKIDGKKEVDIFIPGKNIAIEYDGQHWHEDVQRDLEKNSICTRIGITLLRIREPNLPTLDGLSKDFILGKTNNDYSYMEPAIKWVLDYLKVKEYDIDIPRDIQEIYDLYNKSTVVDSIKDIPSLAEKWDYEKNKINIESVSKWSHIKAWWKCRECGYSYERSVSSEYDSGKCPKCTLTKLIVGHNDLATTRRDLLSLWNYEKNGDLKPTDVTAGSGKKVWWKCDKGHEWEAAVHNVVKGSGCPYCANKQILTGENDLASMKPDVAKLWNYERNGNLKPSDIAPKSSKKVWWKCDKGHEWEAAPNEIVGCPYCSSHRVFTGFNDLATTRPDLLSWWNYERNTGIKPNEVTAGSGKKVWWKCDKGHEWEIGIHVVAKGNRCPYCSNKKELAGFNDLATTRKDLLSLWNYEKNGGLKPTDVTAGSGKKVWWKCDKGHEWQASINKISAGRRCPYCAGRKVLQGFNDLATKRKDLLEFWDDKKNGDLKPTAITADSHIEIWWKCPKGHSWKTAPHSIHDKARCPHCAS